MQFPEEGLVFDYRLEDGGISSTNEDEDEEEEGKQVTEGTGQGGQPMLMAAGLRLELGASSPGSSQPYRVVILCSFPKQGD